MCTDMRAQRHWGNSYSPNLGRTSGSFEGKDGNAKGNVKEKSAVRRWIATESEEESVLGVLEFRPRESEKHFKTMTNDIRV